MTWHAVNKRLLWQLLMRMVIDKICKMTVKGVKSKSESFFLISHGVLKLWRKNLRWENSTLPPPPPAWIGLRWGCVISRRVYHVPWLNSLWHLDGHHSLIRWGLVIHGCIDGFSRRIIFLKCSNNNYATSVEELFLKAAEADGGLWPSRVRVDRGVNVLVCETMVNIRGEGRCSFIAGRSTRNQRIERL